MKPIFEGPFFGMTTCFFGGGQLMSFRNSSLQNQILRLMIHTDGSAGKFAWKSFPKVQARSQEGPSINFTRNYAIYAMQVDQSAWISLLRCWNKGRTSESTSLHKEKIMAADLVLGTVCGSRF